MAERLILALMVIFTAGVARVIDACGRPPDLEDGSPTDEFISLTLFNTGSRVTYECHPGYTLETGSSRYIICREDGTWTPLQATCGPINCGNPGEILNGYYEAAQTTFGHEASFYCDEGYLMIGRPYRLCKANGWDGQVPTCETVTCDDLPPISNGRTPTPPHTENWEYGMVAKYSCVGDYSLIGASELVCTATGQWDMHPPTCKAIKCHRPDTPENAQIVAGFGPTYKYKDTIIYKCEEGFEIIGNSVIQCGENNIFVPPPPTCQNGNVNAVRNGTIDVRNSEIYVTGTAPSNTTLAPDGHAGTIVGQQYELLIILTVFLMVSCCD
ncbi:C4b-binding protein alpha chain-like [Heptranchias perlo]|uniref:C4b-binding protein alpha chain-like n=1 Tax=Heptranchias perlo TaxID=212740 RepID=UPI0035595308